MAADPIVYCLDHLSDYAQFERLCDEVMTLEGYPCIEPLGGCHDKGRDAIHVNRTDNVTTIFCYSVREDWFRKLKHDANVIHKHNHTCDRLVYLSTYNFTAQERDDALKFINDTYGWELELFGLERLRLLLSTKHTALIAKHPQIFHPRFFGPLVETSEIDVIRSLLERLIAANENYLRTHLRLLVWPYNGELSQESLASKGGRITIATPRPETQEPAPIGPDVVLSKEAMHHCSHVDFWGVAGIKGESQNERQKSHVVLLVSGGPQREAAVSEFDRLAAESGRLYQTLPPSIAPIHRTSSPRNLWATVLYGWLRGTSWVSKGDGFEFIGSPFAASAELWRRLLYGTTPDGRIESSSTLSEGAQRILLAATMAKRQTVTMNSNMHGTRLGTGDGPIIETDDSREIAECQAWVEELLGKELIEDRWHKGQVFAVTAKGYSFADELRRTM